MADQTEDSTEIIKVPGGAQVVVTQTIESVQETRTLQEIRDEIDSIENAIDHIEEFKAARLTNLEARLSVLEQMLSVAESE